MNKIAIITARGGSKRIPKKNIRDFLGKPIIAYSIEAALNSNIFNEVMVSTDDFEIAQIAKKYGANVPFMRSAKNSDDYSGSADVLIEVLKEYEKIGQNFDYCTCIYPTAPFISSSLLQNAMKMLINANADCVLPVVQYSYPPQRCLVINDNKAKMLYPENYYKRSQDLEPYYHDCGQFYCLKTTTFLKETRLYCGEILPIIISETQLQDIDTEEDWNIAEIKYKLINGIK